MMMLCIALPTLAEEPAGSLIAHYDFEDAENLGKDVSGSEYHMIPVGKGTLAQSTNAAKGAGALELDGESGLAMNKGTGDDYTDNLESFTVSFYALHDGFVGENSRVFSTGYNGEQKGFCLHVCKYAHNGEQHVVYMPIIGDQKVDHWGRTSEPTKLVENLKEYHWYVCAYDAMTMTMSVWVDGELKATDTYLEPVIPCVLGATIGGSYVFWDDNLMYAFTGLIDDVRVYDYAIESIGEIYGE